MISAFTIEILCMHKFLFCSVIFKYKHMNWYWNIFLHQISSTSAWRFKLWSWELLRVPNVNLINPSDPRTTETRLKACPFAIFMRQFHIFLSKPLFGPFDQNVGERCQKVAKNPLFLNCALKTCLAVSKSLYMLWIHPPKP